MKILKYAILVISIWTNNLTNAQIKHYDFNILAFGGIGFGVMENDNTPNYNMNSNSAELLLKYRITHKFGLATGIGMTELMGNGFNINGNFHHERKLLKIPLLAVFDYAISENISMIPNFGLYTQYIFEDKYRFLNDSYKNIYGNWNFGAQLGVGLAFELFTNFHFGFNYSLHYDLSKFSSNSNQLIINDKQKLNKANAIGIVLVMEL